MDVYASDTESDVESNDNGQEAELSSEDHIRKKLEVKYEAIQGKQMFVRFPKNLPEDQAEFEKKVHALSPLIRKAHKPRQRYARFCLVDFDTENDRNEALQKIRKSIKTDPDFQGIVALIPRTESTDFVKDMIEKKVQSMQAKKAKRRLKKAAKKENTNKEYTSMVIVRNLPKNVSMIEIRNLFPKAIDIQLKTIKSKDRVSLATVTFPTTFDARETVKQKFSMGGTPLSIRFDARRKNKSKAPNSITETKNNEQVSKDVKKTNLEKKAPNSVTETKETEQVSKDVKKTNLEKKAPKSITKKKGIKQDTKSVKKTILKKKSKKPPASKQAA